MEVIHAYTRKQAIEDGVLVDVSDVAEECGLKWPTAITRSVWSRYVQVPPDVSWQDEKGRLWDILWMLRFAIVMAKRNDSGSDDRLLFRLRVQNEDKPGDPPLVSLKAVCGPGDDAEPVITVMLPDED